MEVGYSHQIGTNRKSMSRARGRPIELPVASLLCFRAVNVMHLGVARGKQC